MNGYYQSVYGVVDHKSHQVQEREPSPVPVPPPPKAAPRSTAPPRVTVGALREAKGVTNQRVPITQRVKEPEVPARLRVKKKTVAFGGTVNVSQTVEREKDPHPIDRPLAPRPVSRIPPSTTTPTMSLGRVGVGSDRPSYGTARPLTGAARTPAAAAATPSPSVPVGDENRPPTRGESTREEKKESTAHLETRISELEKRERRNGEKHAELQAQFDKVVKIVTTLTQRVAELEVELEGRRGGGGDRRERSSEDDEGSRSRRRLYSPEERRGEERREQRREKRGGGGGGLMDDRDALRVLDRLSTNPLIRRQIDDAIAQDKYDREYGEEYGRGERRTDSPLIRRGGYDEFDDEPRGANGRCPASAPTQRWKEETRSRPRMTPPRGGGKGMGGGAGVTKKRSDITPSRRRHVTERVTMERVHHFDDTDGESDGGGGGYERYERYDSDEPQQYPRTQYSEEVVDDIQSAVLPKNAGRGGGYGQPPRRNQHQAGPFVTEVSDSEDELERKRRLLKERLEARRGK